LMEAKMRQQLCLENKSTIKAKPAGYSGLL